MDKVAGIVLAGGKSSRMGTNKALLKYQNTPLVEHMRALLQRAGLEDVYISGDVPGYESIHDAVRHDGPARAMYSLLEHFKGHYKRLLFVPVDMPLMQVKILSGLLEYDGSVYYDGHPLPACLSTGRETSNYRSVRALLAAKKARSLHLPSAYCMSMTNINTQKEWEIIAS